MPVVSSFRQFWNIEEKCRFRIKIIEEVSLSTLYYSRNVAIDQNYCWCVTFSLISFESFAVSEFYIVIFCGEQTEHVPLSCFLVWHNICWAYGLDLMIPESKYLIFVCKYAFAATGVVFARAIMTEEKIVFPPYVRNPFWRLLQFLEELSWFQFHVCSGYHFLGT